MRARIQTSRATPQLRNVAERLIAHDANVGKASEAASPAAFQVCEKLRPNLAIFMGNTGFRALLTRALALASAEVPSLEALKVRADGSLEGLEALDAQISAIEISKGRVVLLAHLLGLLVAFIGEDLTLRLVREVWPKLPVNDLNVAKRK